MDLDLCWHVWIDLGMNKSSSCEIFKGLLRFSIEIYIFFSCKCKTRLERHVLFGVNLVVFFWLFIGHQVLGHFFRHQPLLPIGWRILQTLRQRQGKLANMTPLTLHEAPALSCSKLVNYATLVISKDRTKKPLTNIIQPTGVSFNRKNYISGKSKSS